MNHALAFAYCLRTAGDCRTALAQEEESEDEGPWSGNVKLGYLAHDGQYGEPEHERRVRDQLAIRSKLWEHVATGAAIRSTESKVTTAEAYDLGWKSARNISENDFLFGRLDWRKDRFGSIVEQFSQSVGYGRRLIDKEKHTLNGEVGIGARQSDLADGTDTSDTILTGRLGYTWKISENATFGQGLLVEAGDSNTFTESVTEVRANIVQYASSGAVVHGSSQQRRASWCGIDGYPHGNIARIRVLSH